MKLISKIKSLFTKKNSNKRNVTKVLQAKTSLKSALKTYER